MEPAGQYVGSDPATRELSRGAFARVCVRVDLRQPLRPGVRIQGFSAPFWQPFQYEHLAGICPSCGSLHLSGPCSLSSPVGEAESESSCSLFGPWMSAIRQRKGRVPERKLPSKDAGSSPVSSAQPSSSASRSGAAMEGWMVPAKVACRQSLKNASAHLGGPVSTGTARKVHALSSELAPVPVLSNSTCSALILKPGRQRAETETMHSVSQSIVSNNPLALLAADAVAGTPATPSDVNPGPSKRARPEVSLTPRVVSKSGKRKGKGIIANSSELKEKINLTNSVIISKDSGVANSGSTSALACSLPKCDDQSRDSILSRLKLAMKDQSLHPGSQDDALAEAGSREYAIGQSECIFQAAGSDSGLAMFADQGVMRPPLN